MLTKRQFLSLYDETVLGIRQIKNNNDKINKSIGVLNEASLHKETEAEKQMISELFQKVDTLIQKMQKNYLDPDTARKIGVVKQQLRIQKDRRCQLIESVNQITKQVVQKQKQVQKQSQLPYSPQSSSNSKPKKFMEQNSDPSSPTKRSQLTTVSSSSIQQSDLQRSQIHLQMGDFDVQMQHKLLQDRSKQLNHAHERMLNIKNIVSETADLAYAQGDKLDIIGDDLFISYKNVVLANGELEQANQKHKKSRKKYIAFSLLLLIVIGIVLFLVFGL